VQAVWVESNNFGDLWQFWHFWQLTRILAMREIVTLQCGECKERNYATTKNKKTTTGRLEFSKFCKRCRKHTPHKEVK
jgi:large subunit ribosomal protein L33